MTSSLMDPDQPTDAAGPVPAPRLTGRRINPASITVRVDGQTIAAVPGESIASAMIAAGLRQLREDRLGKPRGLFCGMGACFECRVSIDGGAPQRACLAPARPSLSVRTIPYHEPVPASQADARGLDRETIRCDVLVIGAGPAGATAACELAAAGRTVVVLDERRDAGGQYFKQKITAVSASGTDDRQYRDGRRLIERLRRSTARLVGGATAWGAFRDASGQLEIAASADAAAYRIIAGELVVATGASESVPPFPGWTLPGVMTTGAAQSLVRAYRTAPGRRALIAGNGPLNLQLACELADAGVQVVAVAESAPAPFPERTLAAAMAFAASPALMFRGLGYLARLRRHGVPVLFGHHVLSASGADSLTEAAVAPLDAHGQTVESAARRFPVDALCLGYRQVPSSELLRALGCATEILPTGAPAARRDNVGRTSIPGVYAIGDGGTPGGAHVATIEGKLLADALLGIRVDHGQLRRLKRRRRFQQNLWTLFDAPPAAIPSTPDMTVCRCESVSAGTLRALLRSGVRDLAGLKSRSRAGMGFCQGRYCQSSLRALLAEAQLDPSVPEAGQLEARNPVKPITIADIAEEQAEWRGYRPARPPAPPATPALPTTALDEADIIVIGAGVIGAATSLYLGRGGADVLMMDRGLANGEASGSNAGSLHLQLLPFDVNEHGGDSPAAMALPLQDFGIRLWRELQDELQVDFDMSIGGGLMLADNDSDLEFLRRKASLEKQFGVDTEVLSAAETRNLFPGAAAHIAGAAFCAGEGKINPLTATTDLTKAAVEAGVRLRERTGVFGIDYTGSEYRVLTDHGVIACQRIVNATGGWSADIAALLGCQLPVHTAPQQMLVTHPVDLKLPFLLSLARRHLTMKQTSNRNLLIGGGWPAGYDASGRAVTLPESIAGNLWVAKRIMPALGRMQLIRSWATTGVMIDGAPIIGELPGQPGFYNVVGANGYTMGPALGKITADLLLTGNAPVDIAPFSAGRFESGD